MNIPNEIILYTAKYCNFDTLISLLRTSKTYNKSEMIYRILILRTSFFVSYSKLCTKSLEELKVLFYESYNNVKWFESHEDVLYESNYNKYLTQINLDTFNSSFDGVQTTSRIYGTMLYCKHSAQKAYMYPVSRNFEDYKDYTVEDVESFKYFQQYETVFLNHEVASEYLSKENIKVNDIVNDIIFNNREYICVKSLILWCDKCVGKSREQLINLLSLLEDYPDEYIYVIERYFNNLLKRTDNVGREKFHIEERIFTNVLDIKNVECFKLLVSLCVERNILIYPGSFDRYSYHLDKYFTVQMYMKYLLDKNNISPYQDNDLLKVLLSFADKISINILFRTLNASPMKFRLLLPYCDDIINIRNYLKDSPAFYYML